MSKHQLPSLNALRAFEAAARLGRMSAAAEELAVTHGAVSRHVQHLETLLQVELFSGARKNPHLTEAGKILLAALSPAFDQIDAGVRSIRDDSGAVVDVACLSTFAMRWLIPRLHRFQKAHPNIEIRISTNERSIETHRGRYDLLILTLDAAAKPMASDVILFNERLGVVLAPSLWTSRRTFKAENLAALPLLATKTRANAWPMWCAAAGVPMALAKQKKVQTFDHYTFALEAAVGGLGACVTPHHLVEDDLQRQRLIAPLGFVESGYRYIARLKSPARKKTTLFLSWLRREAARETDARPA